ncbi:MAG TPA: type I methionyl aminopeptidase [Actinomycetota bacterium]|nr:type I methionyl aminopeptidase [Actinomycetota bacterium]
MIIKKSPDELDRMRSAGKVVATALQAAREHVRPGVRTSEVDAVVEKVIRAAGCVPSFKGYRGFPGSVCISINEEVVHGIPGPRRIEEGDLVKIDVGAIHDGYHADSAATFYAGESPPEEVQGLLKATEESLWAGIRQVRPGQRLSDISHAVQQVAEGAGFTVVREYVGHGLGRNLHEEPQIPNYGAPGRGPKLEPGMALAIEPMVNAGGWETEVLADEWTVVTADRSLSAHFEHSVAVTDGDPLVLTLP